MTVAAVRKALPLAVLFLAGVMSSAGQTATDLPRFDVASVKPAGPDNREINGFYTYPGGRVVGRGCTLQYLVMIAFNLQAFQIANMPEWGNYVRGERFDVEARPPASSESIHANPALAKNPPNDEQRQMLQALLIDRFHLQIHRDMTQGRVYVLQRNGKPLKLQTPKDPNAFSWAGGVNDRLEPGGLPNGTGLSGRNISMLQLSRRLSSYVNRPVLDQTGVSGAFDFDSFLGPDPEPDFLGSILTALREVGLDMKASTGPVEALVIDHAERPGAN